MEKCNFPIENPIPTRLPDFQNLASEKKEPMFHNFFWLYSVAKTKEGVYSGYRFELHLVESGKRVPRFLRFSKNASNENFTDEIYLWQLLWNHYAINFLEKGIFSEEEDFIGIGLIHLEFYVRQL